MCSHSFRRQKKFVMYYGKVENPGRVYLLLPKQSTVSSSGKALMTNSMASPVPWPKKLAGKELEQAIRLYDSIESGNLTDLEAFIEMKLHWNTDTKYEGMLDIRREGTEDEFPLLVAARMGSTAICELLLKHGCNATARTSSGETALSVAALLGHTNLVQLLLRSACLATIHFKNADGLTILVSCFVSPGCYF